MKRYFDWPDAKETLMVEVKPGSAAARATAEAISKHFGKTGMVREIEHAEYARLTKAYVERETVYGDAKEVRQ
jgi:hypothetical protein